MKTLFTLLIAMVMATGTLYGQTQTPPIPPEEEPEVLTRGPVNEAFAQPVNIDEDNGFTAPEEPPPDIEETLPEERPDGEQYEWVPGYWAWDTDRNEYIWVSGCWRAVPPGKYWVPGYWTEVEDGWRWVAGYWASAGVREIEYLPPPPAVTYVDPPVSTASDRIWVPPCWYWHNGHYTLRSGYWIDAREDWVWIPSHYVWTPRGYVFVNGHWDYQLRNRGILFAPVYFPGHIHGRVRFSYSLSIVVDIGNLEFGLFTRPRYMHYYFGDYYDSFYIGIGIFPWFECVTRHTWYDPIYLHDRWRHRKHNPDWWRKERHEFARRRADKKLRPPRTYREMEHRVHNMNGSQRKNFEIAAPMKNIVERKTNTIRFRKEKPETRKPTLRHNDEIRRDERKRRQQVTPDTVRKTKRLDVKSIPSPTVTRETNVSGARTKNDINQPGRRVYANIKPAQPPKGQEKKQTGSIRIHHMEKPSDAPRREEIRGKKENPEVRTRAADEKKKSTGYRKSTQSQPDEAKEEQRARRR